MAIRLQMRKDSPAVWDSANPALLAGEIGYAWDSADSASFGRIKIGDGTSTWTQLAYFYSSGDSAGLYSSGGGASTWYGARGLYAGGTSGSTNQIEYISVNIGANATDFGDLTVARGQTGAASNGTRAVWAGGYEYGNSARSEVMDYVTIASTGNATDFGNLTAATSSVFHSVVGDGTYGYRMGGIVNPATNVIDRWVQETPANAVDHGDLTISTAYVGAACNGTVIVCAGGYIASDPYRTDTINTFTVGSGSNGTDFGNLTVGRQSTGVGYDLTRAVYAGGYAASGASNVIDYVTMATPGNATDFGDLTTGEYAAGTTDATLCCFATGTGLGANIHKITIQTLGNATDTGYDLLTSYSNGSSGVSGNAS